MLELPAEEPVEQAKVTAALALIGQNRAQVRIAFLHARNMLGKGIGAFSNKYVRVVAFSSL